MEATTEQRKFAKAGRRTHTWLSQNSISREKRDSPNTGGRTMQTELSLSALISSAAATSIDDKNRFILFSA